MNEYGAEMEKMGPLGKGEGEVEAGLKLRLEAVRKLVPYIRLVERERLRVPAKSEEAYEQFFASEEFDRLFKELILDKLAISQITSLLGEKPLSTGEIAAEMGLKPSEVSRHMHTSSMHGLVRYDTDQKRFALA